MPALPQAGGRFGSVALVSFLGLLYCATSAGLIAYNKYLIHADRFPYAVAIVLMHTAFCSCLTGLLFLIRPSLFPSLTDPVSRVSVDSGLIFKGAVPIAFFFAGQLVLSNTAYLHSSVSFLQMMKEANLALVYTLSLVVALEKFSWRMVGILICVMMATALTIHGEMHFSKLGFAIQGISQLFESTKIVLQAMLLSSAGRKLDVLTYVLLVMPFCFLVLGTLFLILKFVYPVELLEVPDWIHIMHWWPHLIANALVAFCLNVIIALFVKHSSAVAFILAGICKDAMIVCAGGFLLKEYISTLQVIGFTMQLAFILLYTIVKTFPEKFEGGILSGLANFICGWEESSRYRKGDGKDGGAAEAALTGAGGRKEVDYGAVEKGANKRHV